jgi:hypothetical protein
MRLMKGFFAEMGCTIVTVATDDRPRTKKKTLFSTVATNFGKSHDFALPVNKKGGDQQKK